MSESRSRRDCIWGLEVSIMEPRRSACNTRDSIEGFYVNDASSSPQ